MTRTWSKSSVRMTNAIKNNLGVQETFNVTCGSATVEVHCYVPFGKGLGRERKHLVDEELTARAWLQDVIDEFRFSLRQCDSSEGVRDTLREFSEVLLGHEGVVRAAYDL